jgi:hypothetical protein
MRVNLPKRTWLWRSLYSFSLLICSTLISQLAFAQTSAANFDETGEIQVSIEDQTLSGPHSVRYDFIVRSDSNAEIFRLLFKKPVATKDLPSGTIARVKGAQSISAENERVVLVEEFEPLSTQSIRSENTTGNRRALPVRVTFSDGSPTASASDIAGFMWDAAKNINGWYQAASNGLVSFPRETTSGGASRVEEVTIAFSKSACNPSGWANAVDTTLVSRGITLSNYDHIIYFLPQTSCSWAGLGNLGCFSTCRAWTNNYGTPNSSTADVVFHELGHNLTLEHARTDPGNTGTASCEYCDTSSAMGYAGIGYRGFPSHSQEQLGWLPDTRVLTSATSQTFTLIPTEINAVVSAPAADLLQLVKVPYPTDATRYYLISLRSRIGSYATNLSSEFNNKVSIHWGRLTETATNLITTLSIGETYTSGAISISYLSGDGTSATVQLTNGTPPTATPTPSATASPLPTTNITPSPLPTRRPGGGPTDPPPPDGASPTATPRSAFGIAAVTVRGIRGNALLKFVSEVKSFTVKLKKGTATRRLPVAEYKIYLMSLRDSPVRRKAALLGSVSVANGDATVPQKFWFAAPQLKGS